MFGFEEHYKKVEELAEQSKKAYEFWIETMLSGFKDLYKIKK
jgi:hypothetical protein